MSNLPSSPVSFSSGADVPKSIKDVKKELAQTKKDLIRARKLSDKESKMKEKIRNKEVEAYWKQVEKQDYLNDIEQAVKLSQELIKAHSFDVCQTLLGKVPGRLIVGFDSHEFNYHVNGNAQRFKMVTCLLRYHYHEVGFVGQNHSSSDSRYKSHLAIKELSIVERIKYFFESFAFMSDKKFFPAFDLIGKYDFEKERMKAND